MDNGTPAGQVERTRTTTPNPSSLDPIAQNQLAQTMGGHFLGGQPANDFITSQVNQRLPGLTSAFSRGGMLNSTGAQQGVADIISDASAGLFNNERNRQLQAASLLPNVVGTRQVSQDPFYENTLGQILGGLGIGAGLLGNGGLGQLGSAGGSFLKKLLGGDSAGGIGGFDPFQDVGSSIFPDGGLNNFNIGDALPGGFDFGLGGADLAGVNPFGDVGSSIFGGGTDLASFGGGNGLTGLGFPGSDLTALNGIGARTGVGSGGIGTFDGNLGGGGFDFGLGGGDTGGGFLDSLFGGGGSNTPAPPSPNSFLGNFLGGEGTLGQGAGSLFSGAGGGLGGSAFAASPAFGAMMGIGGPLLIGALNSGFGKTPGGAFNPITGEATKMGDPIPSLGPDNKLSSTPMDTIDGFVDGAGRFFRQSGGNPNDEGQAMRPITIRNPRIGANQVEGFGQIWIPPALLAGTDSTNALLSSRFAGAPAETNALPTGSSIEALQNTFFPLLSEQERMMLEQELQSGGQ